MPQYILIVDDFVDYAGLLEKRLRAEGYDTLVAHDGEDGLVRVRERKPDLILLDIMMPKIGGTEMKAELMNDPALRDIPIIFLTGLRAPHSKKKSPAGVKTVGKSNDFKELLDAITEALGKPA
jgi:CheY-like chemotaxis protein